MGPTAMSGKPGPSGSTTGTTGGNAHSLIAGDGPASPTGAAMVRLQPLALGEVVLAPGSDLADWQQRNSSKTIPHCIERVISSGAVRNLERVAEGHPGEAPHEGMPFSDSDIYKVLEAAAWDNARGLSAAVQEFGDRAGRLIARAQREDGYLDSWFQGQRPELTWKDLRWGHELYCAGHLLQAAVAARRANSSWDLYGVSTKLLGHLLATFSLEDGDGRLLGVCGHPEIETALVEFYRLSGDVRALRLAKRYIDLRGRADVDLPSSGSLGNMRFPLSYFLHHAPVRQRASATGHAVRELYLQAGVVDVAVETQDQQLLLASEAIWDDLFSTKTYVTGGHGPRHRDESIGDAYELPSDRAYAETCAAIASFQWNWRLLLATGRARYAEAMEQVLWNTIAGAVSRQGTEFFYSNTLHLRTGHDGTDEDSPRHRLPWYECACCPPNIARLMASIQAYLVTRDASGLQMHMPFSGRASTEVAGGAVELTLRSEHPWDGATQIDVTQCTARGPWELSLRAPQWATKDGTTVTINGQPCNASWDGRYVRVARAWTSGDVVRVANSMPVRLLTPHWRADAVRGCVAVQRGPLVYCAEAQDLPQGTVVEDLALRPGGPLTPTDQVPAGLEGYVKVAILAPGERVGGQAAELYADETASCVTSQPLPLKLVPYFARGNRPSAAMRVWLPSRPCDYEGEQPTMNVSE